MFAEDISEDFWSDFLRRPHSTYQKVVQGKCHLHFFISMGPFARTLFSRTLLPWRILYYSGQIIHAKVLEHLVWSNTSAFQFWVPLARTIFLSALRGLPIFQRSLLHWIFPRKLKGNNYRAKSFQNYSYCCTVFSFQRFSDFFVDFPLQKPRALAQGEQKRRKDDNGSFFGTFVLLLILEHFLHIFEILAEDCFLLRSLRKLLPSGVFTLQPFPVEAVVFFNVERRWSPHGQNVISCIYTAPDSRFDYSGIFGNHLKLFYGAPGDLKLHNPTVEVGDSQKGSPERCCFRFFPFLSDFLPFFHYLPFFSVSIIFPFCSDFSLFFRFLLVFLPFFSFFFRFIFRVKWGDSVRETPFAKPQVGCK